MTKARIREFIKEWCDKVPDEGFDMPFHMLELMMDDHRAFKWYGSEYVVQRNNSSYTDEDEDIKDHLVYKFGL